MKLLPPSEAAPLIACVYAAGDVQRRAAMAALNAPRPGRMGASPNVERELPCARDFGLTAREAGMWGRLRASGLSDKDAADVVKACRMEGRR